MSDPVLPAYDAFVLVSFGGPEGPQEVMPFLENVLRGKNVPRERMLAVAEHYNHFGGISPINAQNRTLLSAIQQRFAESGIDLPVYWGNRNWHPMLPDTITQMRADGRQRALAFFTSMFSCYSGCRQYRENIAEARESVGSGAPVIEKLRKGFNHPGFIAAMTASLDRAKKSLGDPGPHSLVLFTAHSIPLSMAAGCRYVEQLTEASRLVAAASGISAWKLVYQSRSGPPHQPWLEPDICEAIAAIDDQQKLDSVIVVPIGFVSDHMEVLFDLDEEAAQLCAQRGIRFARAACAGTDPNFVGMIADLVRERLDPSTTRAALGHLGVSHDVCPVDCCPLRT
jgi:ferrochelatase